MNYTTTTIFDTKIGLKFGMASFRYLTQGSKLSEGKGMNGGELNEIGIAHVLYSGYHNNCIIKDIEPELTFETFVDYIEQNMTNAEFIAELKRIVDVWAANEFIKTATEPEETKKKTTRLRKSKTSHLGN